MRENNKSKIYRENQNALINSITILNIEDLIAGIEKCEKKII